MSALRVGHEDEFGLGWWSIATSRSSPSRTGELLPSRLVDDTPDAK